MAILHLKVTIVPDSHDVVAGLQEKKGDFRGLV
jgi:hypothetical protein